MTVPVHCFVLGVASVYTIPEGKAEVMFCHAEVQLIEVISSQIVALCHPLTHGELSQFDACLGDVGQHGGDQAR